MLVIGTYRSVSFLLSEDSSWFFFFSSPLAKTILGFHVTSSNSRIQNWEAYKIFTFIQGKIT